jgi:hypothetical protein
VVLFDQASTDTLSGTSNGSESFQASCQVQVQSGPGVCVIDALTGTVASRTGSLQILLVAFTT